MALELKEITKVVQGVTHIKPTSLTLKQGHFNVLLGETGSGKTSLIKMMAGLDPIASGQILMDGVDVTKLTTQKRKISLVHQFFVNYPHMTVFENIASPLKVAGMAKSEIEGRVQKPLTFCSLPRCCIVARMNCQVVSSSVAPWRVPLPRKVRPCSWMSRWPTWTTNCAKNCATNAA